MATATWDDVGSRLYQTGVDRGMLYVNDTIPLSVPWNGLVSVTETPSGGDPQPYYLDGRKILNVPAGEDFAATIVSFSPPFEFAACSGRFRLSNGLYSTCQPKKTFGFSYRTLIGNDVAGNDFAYKVHVVYNALAQLSDFTNSTITDSPAPTAYSWTITTTPVTVPGSKSTAHIIFDTRFVNASVMNVVEDILYGDYYNDPRLPSALELSALLSV
jgi:hypothetical protein